MINIGCHLSSSKGFKNMGENALKIGANTFQFFTRNPRGSKAKDIDEKDVEEFLELAKENNFGKILAHAPYTLNPCSADDRNREFAIEIMKDDLNRMEYIPNNLYNFHPGNHVKQGVEVGIEYIVYALNSILKKEQTTKVLLETMSGKGTEIGRNFEEIAEIIKGTRLKNHIGVCLDTCHIYDAGYDIVNELDKVLDEFHRVIGLDKLCAIHLNDSKNPFKSHKDRHETIGEGYIGLDAIFNIINHKKLCHLPFFLETPNELEGHKREIELLKGVYKW
ncbi:deoxyribonuclease IV [Clostridium algidicarnis]|uniref:deoxyribonuclease IV n=1 Tax=Clostridium algidicarnis TaxID=37659 RepID=UPI001C0AF768|nr:deoxyribonuclease IV [Clostridium algidicarnis]MBU3203928.1 deoxyribonuclease IV [Clostridium algidicarnis]MBU3212082.1 deoxyribonuclease IV [Clostridium algidicarnis]MBU3221412.1 deoxyribonuclease IV [Clostridium algidicarnis]